MTESIATSTAYEIRRSPIHGTGVFAARDLSKGERIVEYTGELISKAESERRGLDLMEKALRDGGAAVYIFSLDDEWDLDGDQPDNDARLINHSCDPNCEAWNYDNRLFIEAKRAIEKGEELSFDYGFSIETWEDHPCRCGTPKCPGYIVARKDWPKLRRAIAAKLRSSRGTGNGKNGKNGRKAS
ncbi:MAG: SET domain-containing protein [Verrucomicrobiales bacterium]